MKVVDVVRRVLGGATLRIDRAVIRVKSRFGLFRPLRVQVYRGHGSPERLRIAGRVIEKSATEKLSEDGGLASNLRTTLHRFESDEIPEARVRVEACGVTEEVVTDHEGYFAVELRCDRPVASGWHPVRALLLSSPAHERGVRGDGELLIPDADCEFGVISDLDDTVIDTGARNKATQARHLLSRNARTHPVFPGIADFYRLLLGGPDGNGANPIFYVSKSAWNLYDLFEEFLERHSIPRGPMFLYDATVIEPKSPAVGDDDHKPDTIDDILELHPELPFVLIGDSGQHDAETFLDVVKRHPGRIRAVYLRDVSSDDRDREVADLLGRIEELGVPARAAAETVELARHAEGAGLIPAGASDEVARGSD